MIIPSDKDLVFLSHDDLKYTFAERFHIGVFSRNRVLSSGEIAGPSDVLSYTFILENPSQANEFWEVLKPYLNHKGRRNLSRFLHWKYPCYETICWTGGGKFVVKSQNQEKFKEEQEVR